MTLISSPIMPSQKRYRHHQENNNNNPRYRDLPPRFKRQKSSSSPTESNSPSPVNGEPYNHQVSNNTPEPIIPQSFTMSPSPSAFSPKESPLPNNHGYLSSRQNSQQVVCDPSIWSQRRESQSVLCPVDNMHANLARSTQSPSASHVSLGTNFGFKVSSPPMSPWPSSSPLWHSPTDPYVKQRHQSPPGFMYNENQVPYQRAETVSPTFYPISPIRSLARPASKEEMNSKSSRVGITRECKPEVDYSDPDIRTIEMLRELERVADEKENEEEEIGSDRKTLVSHHLRMLMCAVDRYTEGVEDEIGTGLRGDDACQVADSPAHTPGPSPAPHKMWTQEVSQKESPVVSSANNYSSTMWSQQNFNTPSPWTPSVQSFDQSAFQPQPFPVWPVQQGPVWDLWNSPEFDVFNPMGTCSTGKERKPLYKR